MKRTWLIIFNVLTLIAWAVFFVHALFHGLAIDEQGLMLLTIAQGLAVFEIMNAMLGLAGANWLLTTAQVFSRLLIVFLLNWIPIELLSELNFYSGFVLVTVAWSVTEIVRALYYLTEIGKQPVKAITFSRYTFFIFLYPLGVAGEFMTMFTFWEWRLFEINVINLALAGVAVSYFVFFPKLYGHMWKQRRKKLISK
ncbi:MAG: protein tyrosine phosphatase-like domain-containing protein [Flavobacteriales bacterium]|nr:protein tyrosine phosphatase-like domain-containing protein [Flavobacteriales bacterium]